MNLFRRLVPLVLLAAACAHADPHPVVVTDAPRGSESTINVQSSQGTACASPGIGNCGTCSVSCPTGKAAMCKPGIAVNAKLGASCVTPPECRCQ
jgi:hypothetical protein